MADFTTVMNEFIGKVAQTAYTANKTIIDTFMVGGKGVTAVATDASNQVKSTVDDIGKGLDTVKWGAIGIGALALLLLLGGNRR